MSFLIANASLRVAVRRLSVSGFVALSLVLAACGGGGGGSENSRLDSKSPYTEKPTGGNGSQNGGNAGNDADDGQVEPEPGAETPDTEVGTDTPEVEAPSAETPNENPSPDTGDSAGGDSGEDAPNPDTATPDPDDGAVVDGGGSEPDAGAEEPSAGDDSGLLEEIVSEVNGAVRLEWDRPEFRENGEYLEGDEIGGYELRYRKVGEEAFETVIVTDGWDEDYELGELVGSYQFTIAAFDNKGLYSEFVSLAPATGLIDAL